MIRELRRSTRALIAAITLVLLLGVPTAASATLICSGLCSNADSDGVCWSCNNSWCEDRDERYPHRYGFRTVYYEECYDTVTQQYDYYVCDYSGAWCTNSCGS